MEGFVKIAKSDEIQPGQGKMVEVDGKKIALFNVDGAFYAIDDTCTHRGGPLSEGELSGKEVTCPLHLGRANPGRHQCQRPGSSDLSVLNGHDHFYERVKPQKGIAYFVVGSGGQLRVGNIDRGSGITTKGFDTDLAFMAAEITGDQMYFNVISRLGQTVDSGVLTRRNITP